MRSVIHFAGFLLLAPATALPHLPPPSRPATAIVTLRLLTSPQHTQHYTPTQQFPTTPQGDTLHIMVGQALSMDTAPLYLQGVEIASVTAGVALTSPPREVEEDDERVLCMVKTGFASSGLIFGRDVGVLAFGGLEGGVATVTGVECWVP